MKYIVENKIFIIKIYNIFKTIKSEFKNQRTFNLI